MQLCQRYIPRNNLEIFLKKTRLVNTGRGGRVVLVAMFQIQVETDALVTGLNLAWGMYLYRQIYMVAHPPAK